MNTWYGVAYSQTTTSGPQDTIRELSSTSTSTLTTSGFFPGSDQFVTTLTPGVYDISYSLSVGQLPGPLVIWTAIGIHSPPAANSAVNNATPIVQPLNPSQPAISSWTYSPVVPGVPPESSLINIAARGGVTVTTPINNVGIIFMIPADPLQGATLVFASIEMTVTKLE
jgi:hypothetical protein